MSRPGSSCEETDVILVAVESLGESMELSVHRQCSVTQLKLVLSDLVGAPAEQLVLIHSGRVLRESEVLSPLLGHNDSVTLCMIQRPQCSSPVTSGDATSETVLDLDDLAPSPTSLLSLVEGLGGLCLDDSSPGFFPALHCQMEKQLLDDPEMMCRVMSNPLVETILSTTTYTEVGELLNDVEIITQMLLSHPVFSEWPELQQQVRQRLPLFLQQTQANVLSATLSPRAVEALQQIQQGLHILAVEAPDLLPAAGLRNPGASVSAENTSNSAANSQSGNRPHVATVTEQQQQLVHQMLLALTITDNEAQHQRTDLQEDDPQ